MIDSQSFYPEMNASQEKTSQHDQASRLPYSTNTSLQQGYTSQPYQVSGPQVLPSSQPSHSPVDGGISTARPAPTRRPRPVTMHGSDLSGFNYLQGQIAHAPWGAPENLVPAGNGVTLQTFQVNQASYETMAGIDDRPTHMHLDQTYQKLNGTWNPNAYGDVLGLNGMGFTSNAGISMLTTDVGSYNAKRVSGSSYTMSATGAPLDVAGLEDYSASASEAQSFVSDQLSQSNRASLMSSIQSPVTSPSMSSQHGPGLYRTHSRGKASPTSKHNVRSTPYSADGRTKRWSTGSYAPTSRRAPSPFVLHPSLEEGIVHCQEPSALFEPPGPYIHYQPLNMANLQSQQYPYISHPIQPVSGRSMILPSNDFNQRILDTQAPRQMPHSLFRMLQSNAEPVATHLHYDSQADRPDLRAALHEEQSKPPPGDMNPSDPNLIPHEQELRFDTDLYTPRWIRGQGKDREGWCGICKPGKWLTLKTSAFWYDKSFMHGISAPTGKPFAEPREMRRSECNPELWEGSCGGCGGWVAMTSHKKKGTTWFRHAYRCHTHPKTKEATKTHRKSLENPLPACRGVRPQSSVKHHSPSRTSGGLSRGTLDSTPEDYNMT